ncbi:MAG: efflux RND transporter periplasmic adaptor subunit [Blastocatellia bacterium]
MAKVQVCDLYCMRRNQVVCLAALFILLELTGCSKSATTAPGAAQAATPAPLVVTVANATMREAPGYLQATGSLLADEQADLAPQIAGQIAATPVDVGAFVKAGDVIARLDDRDVRLRLQQAQSSEQQAVAAVRQAQARLGLGAGGRFDVNKIPEVRAARQQYDAAQAQANLAETNARRYANLLTSGDVAQSVYDQARAQAETARAQANAARQQYEAALNTARQSNQGISAAQAALSAAQAQTALAQKAASDTTIRAPFAGFISDRPAAPGEYITTTSKIATLVRSNPIKVSLQLPEADAGRVGVGQAVIVTVTAFPDREFSGQITAINPALDPAVRAVVVQATIANPQNQLRPGMFATARIAQPSGGPTAFVPRAAVMADSTTNTSSVYVIEGETARLRQVHLGQADGDQVQILSGLKENDVVATSNLEQLYDGARVQRKTAGG